MRVAVVVQRYGVEVLGGAETLARHVAELIAKSVDLTVLTTCAVDYVTWTNQYPPGPAEVNGVSVLRFAVDSQRSLYEFEHAAARAYALPDDLELGREWLRAQGPNAASLLEHLRASQYDAVAFFTYLYAPTVEGLPLVAEHALLCPTLHDELPLRLRVFDEIFARARLLLFLTPEERDLARERFGVSENRARLVGAAVDEHPRADPVRFVSATGIDRPYAVYSGRLDPAKGIGELVGSHSRYRAAHPDGLDLVLLGEGELKLPASGCGLHALGYVPEELKHDALAGAVAVVCPSPHESLSLAQLEAWSHGRPTLVNAASPVLVGQSRRSGGGLWYSSPEEYGEMLNYLATGQAAARGIGAQGRSYVQSAHSRERVREAWLAALEEVAG